MDTLDQLLNRQPTPPDGLPSRGAIAGTPLMATTPRHRAPERPQRHLRWRHLGEVRDDLHQISGQHVRRQPFGGHAGDLAQVKQPHRHQCQKVQQAGRCSKRQPVFRHWW